MVLEVKIVVTLVLGSVAQWSERRPASLRVADLIPELVQKATSQCVSLT